ncbi:MAG: RluA family pseudouridine synthase [Gemmataceae bacterium]|nr:RluA family pseudouridine synthase [Gemmataceae bacterium]
MPPLVFVVDRREAGKTLAAVLKARYGLSWSRARRLVEGRHVRIGQHVETDVARRLKPGKQVWLAPGAIEIRRGGEEKRGGGEKADGQPAPKGQQPKPAAEAKPRRPEPRWDIELVYTDDHVVVVNKPAGLTTMRHAKEAAEFGERGQRYLTKTLGGLLPGLLGAPNRPVFAVHRLDRDTSGLVVFARTPAAAEHLTKQFKKHSAERRYVALTRGVPEPGRVESVLVPDRGDGRRGSTRKTNPPDGKRAVTHVKVLEEMGDSAAVECRLETGRTHQVRIHLGELGTPLCGEPVYDRAINRKPVPDGSGAARPMLHAARLGFVHPETGEPMSWEAKPPADFASVWAKLRPVPPG